jgi:ABC-type dipeptide/oligopeptide/nickel transport system permease subunit
MADTMTRPDGGEPSTPPIKPSASADRPTVLTLLTRGMRWVRARHWTFKVGAVLLTAIVLILLLTPWIAPHDPASQDLANRLADPSGEHWFGTDHLGRDVLSRLMWGGRFAMTIAAISLVICAVTGSIIGALAARRGGSLDELMMRTVDVLICFPDVVIALFLIALFGPGYGTLILALTITGWTPFARLMRGLALDINSRDFVEAAEILGSPKAYILFRHIIPNAAKPVLAMAFLRFGHKLITVGALSYLGLGVQPPDSDWGAMLLDAQPYMERAPGLGILPGAAIFLAALSVTMIGQGLDLKRTRRKTAAAAPPPETAAAALPASRMALDQGEAV